MKKLPKNFVVDKNTDWHNLACNYSLPEEFMEKYSDRINEDKPKFTLKKLDVV